MEFTPVTRLHYGTEGSRRADEIKTPRSADFELMTGEFFLGGPDFVK